MLSFLSEISIEKHTHLCIFFFFALSCPSLSSPANGNVVLSSGLVMGSTATYTCNNGYKATYTTTRYCQADGQWSGGEPSCIRKCFLLTVGYSYFN